MSKKKVTKKKAVAKKTVTKSQTNVESDNFDDSEAEQDIQVENPAELYTSASELELDGSSVWARFRAWAHKKKRLVYVVFLITLVGSFGYLMKQSAGQQISDLLSQYFNKFNSKTSTWVYQIGEYRIDKEYLRRLYPLLVNYTYGESGAHELRNDNKIYQEFLKQQFETDLMAYAALQTEVLKNPEAQMIIENAIRRAIADYYLYSRIKDKNNDFRVKVTNTEVISFYEKNRAVYDRQGMDRLRALAAIRGTLTELKADRVRRELQSKRKAVIEGLKNSIGPKFRNDT